MIEAVAQSLLPLASWVGFASLKSLIVIPLVLLLRRLCARWLTQQGRYGLWFALVACLAFPFGAEIRIGGEPRAATPTAVRVVTSSSTINDEPAVVRIDVAPAAAAPDLSMASKAVLIWLLGIASLAGVVTWNVHRYRRITSRASEVDAATEELFQRCKQLLKIDPRVRLLETAQIPSPVVVGYWRPTLLLPQTLSAQVSSGQLRLVLLHELTHVRRHDILVNWVVTVVQIAHWFNPLAWYALRVMRNDMEQACDAGVLRRLSSHEQTEYGDTLIRLSDLAAPRSLLVQNASVVDSRSQLKSRIHMIAQFKPRGAFSSILAAVLITLTSSIAITQAATAPQQPASAAPRPAPPAATKQAAAAPEARTPLQSAGRSTAAEPKKGADAPELEFAQFQVNYTTANRLVTFIKSTPGMGLLSEKGSIAADEKANTFLVRDAAENIATIRQLVATLDVPVQQVLVSAVIALVDNDLLQELTAGRIPAGARSPFVVVGSEQAIMAALEAGQKAQRVEFISMPRWVVENRARGSIAHNARIPPEQDTAPGALGSARELSLSVTPTVLPDNRVQLDVDVTVNRMGKVVVVSGDTQVPAIDTAQSKGRTFLESRETVLLDVVESRASPGRRMVAFVTPTIVPGAPARSR